MRGFKRDHTARVIIRGHALMQNIRCGHYELGVDARTHRRVEHAFTELARHHLNPKRDRNPFHRAPIRINATELISTTITDTTPPSMAHPSPASTTCLVNTTSASRGRPTQQTPCRHQPRLLRRSLRHSHDPSQPTAPSRGPSDHASYTKLSDSPASRDRVHRTRPHDLTAKQEGNSASRGLIRNSATAPPIAMTARPE